MINRLRYGNFHTIPGIDPSSSISALYSCISSRAFGSWLAYQPSGWYGRESGSDMDFSIWYEVWYENCHIIISMYHDRFIHIEDYKCLSVCMYICYKGPSWFRLVPLVATCGCPKSSNQNQPAQLQRLYKKLKFRWLKVLIWYFQ